MSINSSVLVDLAGSNRSDQAFQAFRPIYRIRGEHIRFRIFTMAEAVRIR